MSPEEAKELLLDELDATGIVVNKKRYEAEFDRKLAENKDAVDKTYASCNALIGRVRSRMLQL